MEASSEKVIIKNPYTNLERDLLVIVISVFFAIGIVRLGVIQDIVSSIDELKIIGSFIAGFFFTSAFTIAPAAIALAEISQTTSPLLVAFWGALGSLVGDLVIFLFIRDRFADDVMEVLHTLKNEKKIKHFFKRGFFRWLSPLLAALIIASPLPDEFAIALLGISKVRMSIFIPISFVMSFFGILIVALVAGSF
ncbi:MAG: hypothetical protein RL292_48 [Candidatus Parcubacteria bacterium]|jgi:uncharacterized membrane protein YdjX (TVP38/TMEM64 family)